MNNFPIDKSPRKKCLIGTKALHSLSISYEMINMFSRSISSPDHFLLAALYQTAVMKYAKPFTDMRINGRPERYQIKRIRSAVGFDQSIHDKLIEIRNTLVAHDDLDHLEPKILHNAIQIENYSIPIETYISNKALLYLADSTKVSQVQRHIEITRNCISETLGTDLEQFRRFVLDNPEEAKKDQKYEKKYGTEKIEIGGTKLQPPDVSNDEFLDVLEPEAFHSKNGYSYHDMKIRKSHLKEETIELPNGESLIIHADKN